MNKVSFIDHINKRMDLKEQLDQIPLMSLEKMWDWAKKHGVYVKYNELRDYLQNNRVAQITRPVRLNERKKKIFDHIVAPERKLGHLQVDLLDMSKWGKQNKGYNYALVVIDISSRFGVVKPLKTKTAREVWEAMRELLDGGLLGVNPIKSVTSDNGGEFMSEFADGLKRRGIKHTMNIAGDHYTMGMVERFNRTLRTRFVKQWVKNRDFNWVGVLPEVVQDYNQSIHSGIHAVPEDVWTRKVEVPVILRNPQHLENGTLVRRLIVKSLFDKGESSRWSHSVYEIDGKVGQKYWLKKDSERLEKPVGFHSLMVVKNADEEVDNEALAEREYEIGRQRRVARALKQEGVEAENVGLRRLRGDERMLRARREINYKV